MAFRTFFVIAIISRLAYGTIPLTGMSGIKKDAVVHGANLATNIIKHPHHTTPIITTEPVNSAVDSCNDNNKCPTNYMCLNGKCHPTCASVSCPINQTCVMKTECSHPPCYPTPVCQPTNVTDPIPVRDKCDSANCPENTKCQKGTCVPLTCEDLKCGVGEECSYIFISCLYPTQCNPIPRCIKTNKTDLVSDKDECDVAKCGRDTMCVDGKCVPRTCESLNCSKGEKCQFLLIGCVDQSPCNPIPVCVANNELDPSPGTDKCNLILCPNNTICINGTCVPRTCENVTCDIGQTCVLEETACKHPPCHPVPTCKPTNSTPEPFNKCSIVFCAFGTKCIDGKCFPLTCADIACKTGEICKIVVIQCFVPPCPPSLPTCVPDPRNDPSCE